MNLITDPNSPEARLDKLEKRCTHIERQLEILEEHIHYAVEQLNFHLNLKLGIPDVDGTHSQSD